jgi:DNA-directed RNA polymerase specialized sigma24 family protein
MPGPHELARLYDAHADAADAYVANLARSEADARDLLQELFRRDDDAPLPDVAPPKPTTEESPAPRSSLVDTNRFA